ncbi:MAG: TonB-dependent receptor [Candidatus Aminicenantes bacterium]|nr:TonB-dependent receptor [Candidatus Aminicenantes bacterium]
MKKYIFALGCLILAAGFAAAQDPGGIVGRVMDAEKNPLAGVAVTLSGGRVATQYAVTTSEGMFRFVSLPAASDYALELDLPGFKTLRRDRLVAAFGRDVRLTLTLEPLPPDEMITISGRTPMIDKNDRRAGYAADALEIIALPTPRDPWILLAMAPGLVADRENVGGAESGLQAYVYGAGAAWTDTVWTLEGTDITDPSVPGDSPVYVDMSNYAEIRAETAGGDARTRTPGLQLHLVPRRGGPVWSGGFHFDMADKSLELNNIPLALSSAGLGSPGISTIRLYGGNLGGMLLNDRLWGAGAFGIQDITKRTMTGALDAAFIASGYTNFDLKISPTARLNALFAYDEKRSSNRAFWGDTEQAPETRWTQTGPSLTGKVRFEKKMGAFLWALTGLVSSIDFHLQPVNGARTPDGSGNYQIQDFDPAFYVSGNANDYRRKSRQLGVAATGRAFFDHILGGGHELSFGIEMRSAAATLSDTIEGNLILQDYGYGWVEANLLRDTAASYGYTRFSAFAQDTIDWGRVSLTLGLRYDREHAVIRNQIVPESPWLPQYLTGLNVSEYDPGFVGSVVSPRIGLSYDLRGDGRDVLRLSLALFGSQTGMDPAVFINPASAGIGLLWRDADGNGRVAMNELWGFDWQTGQLVSPDDPAHWLYAWGFDPSNPSSYTPANQLASSYATPLTDEILLSYEKEILPDFGARLEVLYRKRHRLSLDSGILAGGQVEDASNWVLIGHNTIVDTDYWTRLQAAYGTYRDTSQSRFEQYTSVTLSLTKRYARGWMLDGSFTYADWKANYGGDYLDPTNVAYFNGAAVAPESQGADLAGVFVNSRWTAKLAAMVRLPFGFNASGVLTAREGFIIPTYTIVQRPNIGPTLLYGVAGGGGKLGDTRLPTLFLLNVRLEKEFAIGDRIRLAIGADGFNILNASTSLKQAGRIEAADFLQTKLILNPAVFRLGARVAF